MQHHYGITVSDRHMPTALREATCSKNTKASRR
jgi:hypothetical protein